MPGARCDTELAQLRGPPISPTDRTRVGYRREVYLKLYLARLRYERDSESTRLRELPPDWSPEVWTSAPTKANVHLRQGGSQPNHQ